MKATLHLIECDEGDLLDLPETWIAAHGDSASAPPDYPLRRVQGPKTTLGGRYSSQFILIPT